MVPVFVTRVLNSEEPFPPSLTMPPTRALWVAVTTYAPSVAVPNRAARSTSNVPVAVIEPGRQRVYVPVTVGIERVVLLGLVTLMYGIAIVVWPATQEPVVRYVTVPVR